MEGQSSATESESLELQNTLFILPLRREIAYLAIDPYRPCDSLFSGNRENHSPFRISRFIFQKTRERRRGGEGGKREFCLSRKRVEGPFQSSALQRERERNDKLSERTKDASLFSNSENETTFSEAQNKRNLVGELLILRNFRLSAERENHSSFGTCVPSSVFNNREIYSFSQYFLQ